MAGLFLLPAACPSDPRPEASETFELEKPPFLKEDFLSPFLAEIPPFLKEGFFLEGAFSSEAAGAWETSSSTGEDETSGAASSPISMTSEQALQLILRPANFSGALYLAPHPLQITSSISFLPFSLSSRGWPAAWKYSIVFFPDRSSPGQALYYFTLP